MTLEYSQLPTLDYILSGGNANHNYKILIEAIREIETPIKIVTENQGIKHILPHVQITQTNGPNRRLKFWKLVAQSLFVVLPLNNIKTYPNGITTACEAMRFKKVVIATKNTGLDDMIQDGYNGLLVPDNDCEALIIAIKKLLNPQYRRQLEQNIHRNE